MIIGDVDWQAGSEGTSWSLDIFASKRIGFKSDNEHFELASKKGDCYPTD